MEKARKYGGTFKREVSASGFAIRVVLTILLLQTVYPNLIHEPSHLVALTAFGQTGSIVFDWIPPATPYMNYVLQNAEVWQVLIVFMLPSVINIVFIAWLGTLRTRFPVIKIGAISYLAFDLITNIRGFQSPISDFRWLQYLDFGEALSIIMILLILALTLWGIFRGVNRVKIVKRVKVIKDNTPGGDYESTSNNGFHGSRSVSRRDRTAHVTSRV